jgi:hypothetical protein
MAEPASDSSEDRLQAIADQLERLARALRMPAESEPGAIGEGAGRSRDRTDAAVEEAVHRIKAEGDRAVREAAHAIDRNVAIALAAVMQAEREARERILAATEAACERIEAVDRAQERVAEALRRLEPRAPGEAATGDG